MSKTLAEKIAVMQAALTGKKIECLQFGGGWAECKPLWNWCNGDYRVKPEQKTRRMTVQELTDEVAKRRVWLRTANDEWWSEITCSTQVNNVIEYGHEISTDLKTWRKPEVTE